MTYKKGDLVIIWPDVDSHGADVDRGRVARLDSWNEAHGTWWATAFDYDNGPGEVMQGEITLTESEIRGPATDALIAEEISGLEGLQDMAAGRIRVLKLAREGNLK